MKDRNINKNFIKLVVFSLFIILITTSATSSVVNIHKNNDRLFPPYTPLLGENYYEWIDEFNNEQNIDITKSWGYVVEDGHAKMKNTYDVWDDPDWTRMVPITVKNSGDTLSNYAINFEVEYDSDMDSDYEDLRFKHEDAPTNFLKYWIESYNTSSASIWVKVPTLKTGTNNMYLFYGNSKVNSESSFGDTFTDWDLQWANDEQITYHSDNEGAWDPDVCYGDGNFLVAWEEGPAFWVPYSYGYKQEIRASIYVPDDDDPVVFDKRIFNDGYTYYRNENPSIAFNGDDKWLVTWENYEPKNLPPHNPSATTMDIKGRTVKKSGSDLSLGTVYDICDEDNCQADSKVVYDSKNDRFMVIWEDARSGMTDYDLYARFVNADTGQPSGNYITICDESNSQCEPWAAFDSINEQYFIVWEEGLNPQTGPFKIMGGIFDEDLTEIDTFTVAQPSDPDNVDYNFPCVSFDEDTELYLVTWNDGDISDGDWRGNIWGKIYDSSGDVEVDQFQIKDGNFVRTDIVPYLSKAFLVSFDNGAKIYGRLVSSEGDIIGSDIGISGYTNADADWANMDTDGSNIFVAWEDFRINYPPPYDDQYPDGFGNSIHLNIPDGSDITITFGQEKELILSAQITSDPIAPANLESWHDFQVEFENTITFDILDGDANEILIEDASNGEDLGQIDPEEHPSICLQAHFSRNDPSYTPSIDWWKIRYVGRDDEPPKTSVDWIDGVMGKNEWYISESVTMWLKAVDYPEDTGSGVNRTYYTIDGGSQEIYNEESGIYISSYEPDWTGVWLVNFWSVDKKGNVEDKTKPENYRTIKIDSRPPEIEITSPEEEEEVKVPFWVYADASDNAGLEKVEFDIEPFGKRPGLPFVDTVPPYKWECNEWPLVRGRDGYNLQPLSANVQIRAHAFDVSGQEWIHQVFVNILNWNSRPRVIVIPNFKLIIENLKLGLAFDKTLNIDISGIEEADSVEFVATKIFSRQKTTILDNDFSDGISASFDIPTGFYKIMMTSYKDGEELTSELISRIFFISQ